MNHFVSANNACPTTVWLGILAKYENQISRTKKDTSSFKTASCSPITTPWTCHAGAISLKVTCLDLLIHFLPKYKKKNKKRKRIELHLLYKKNWTSEMLAWDMIQVGPKWSACLPGLISNNIPDSRTSTTRSACVTSLCSHFGVCHQQNTCRDCLRLHRQVYWKWGAMQGGATSLRSHMIPHLHRRLDFQLLWQFSQGIKGWAESRDHGWSERRDAHAELYL